jgi:hypothetical protein
LTWNLSPAKKPKRWPRRCQLAAGHYREFEEAAGAMNQNKDGYRSPSPLPALKVSPTSYGKYRRRDRRAAVERFERFEP